MKEFSALRKRVRVKWHSDGSARMTIPNAYGGVNEIGRIETSVSSQRGTNIGQVKWVEIDPKFRGMGLATKMYGEAMKGAPRGRLVSDNAQYDGGHGIWNKLQRSKGYKIRENPKIDGAGFDDLISRDGRPMFIGRINPAARMQWAQSRLDERSLRSFKPSSSKEYFSAKLRLRELARGDFAIPALGKMLRDRSMLEEFMTGKRGPKMGDLRHNFNGGIFTDSSWLAGHIPGLLRPSNSSLRRMSINARQKGRDAIAKMIRKGRAGGDVYEEVNRS
jgi:hypothetical protein